MPYRLNVLFAVTTAPTDPLRAVPHSGGWSETHWSDIVPNQALNFNTLLMQRALMLPTQCAIIGYRQATYTVAGNRLIPGGTSTAKLLLPGQRKFHGGCAASWT